MARRAAKQKPIPFMKLSGSGNDFILVDNRRGIVDGTWASALAAKICTHRMSVGGDGLILIERSRKAHFRWRLFNADGSEAEFSGNGARCAARFAYLKRIAPRRMKFETLAGVIEADMVAAAPGGKPEAVKVRFPDPKGLRLNLNVTVNGATRQAHFLDTGVPHCVYLVDDPDKVDLVGVGRPTRYHDLFKPAGTNVNFIKVLGPHRIRIRTYERGVEDETLACGTGSIASALLASLVAKVESPVTLVPESGLELTVYFDAHGESFTNVYLQGDARAVYEGRILPDAWK
ncbi:MAG: diaminopimelate epimerase [Nitrospirae bacterium RIFCSPLOWO2_01_FULL_62_17]|nr:MAG: diaminopimelate epimerase [Nitrospirae bacterium RIFCSPLOWO2_01_FULL_62_17]